MTPLPPHAATRSKATAAACGFWSVMGICSNVRDDNTHPCEARRLTKDADKRLWLRPGRSFLFGRTKEGSDYIINNKSVSRKHLLISVAAVKPGDGVRAHARSELTIKDDSKLGTYLDGEKLVQASRVLTKEFHQIKLGSYALTFKITWKPVVLCFSFPDKQQKSKGSEILAPYQARLEALDIKVMLEFIYNTTTHVVASKRNTAKGLQALITGGYIVTDAFVNAIERSTTPSQNTAPSEAPPLSPLEESFDENWPNALDYLPDPGKEPAPRAAEFFSPDPRRQNIFEGYTFVISDDTQFTTLQPVMLSGGAKCVRFNMKFGQTTLDEFVAFVKNVAGEKGIGEFEDVNTDAGVVVVRFRSKEAETFDWAIRFIEMADAALGQRSVEQNEFLDAILANDPRRLRQPLRDDVSQGHKAPPSTAISANSPEKLESTATVKDPPSSAPSQSQKDAPTPPKKRTRRIVTKSRFKGFDDFDASQLPKSRGDLPMEVVGNEGMNTESQSLFVGTSQDYEPSAPDSNHLNKKRKEPPIDEVEEQAMMDSLLPAAAAMKRRRVEEAEEALRVGKPLPDQTNTAKATQNSSTVIRKEKPPMDVRSVARTRREELDLAAARESEALNAPIDAEGVENVSELRNLAIIEEIEVPGLANHDESSISSNQEGYSAARKAREQTDGRWDESWDGRKNFKKFRPQARPGEHRSTVAAAPSRPVIVTLEEVKRKEFGIGESYWLPESKTASFRSRDASKDKNSRELNIKATQRGKPTREAPLKVDPDSDIEEVLPEEISGELEDPELSMAVDGAKTRSAQQAATVRKGKRPAVSSKQAVPSPPSKKLRQSRIQATRGAEEEEESDEDGMKFRFRRSRRAA